jgi:C4-dicarboxylate-specific signal transduction histidine kinase
MQQTFFSTRGRFALSLSVRVSLLLVLATLLPLIITITSSEFLSRPQLIANANASMETDAQTHIQTIENFFSQPIIDVRALSQNPALSAYLNGETNAATAATNVLETGYQHNTNYISWSLIDPQGRQQLFYPVPSQPHGQYFVPPDTAKQLVAANSAAISSDYYDPQGSVLTVDITEPVTITNTNAVRILGYLRATVNIKFLWNMIQSESNANGADSYAFITDENGVVIAHTDIAQVFTAIAPFTSSQQENIITLDRYGADAKIAVWPQSALSDKVNQQSPFQFTLQQQQQQSYQVIGLPVSIVPWTYFVLSPTSVVTSLADQQLLTIGIIGTIVLLLAAVIGTIVGQRITWPVLRSVIQLQASSQILKELASQEQVVTTQQSWVVDSSRTGLSSVNHYLDASQNAANRIIMSVKALESTLRPEERQLAIRQILVATHYIESALQQQKINGKKLSATLDLTQQVADQLNSSTEAVTRAAEQMEEVVSQLQQVVGKTSITSGGKQ